MGSGVSGLIAFGGSRIGEHRIRLHSYLLLFTFGLLLLIEVDLFLKMLGKPCLKNPFVIDFALIKGRILFSEFLRILGLPLLRSLTGLPGAF